MKPANAMLAELEALREVNRIVLDLLSLGCYACGAPSGLGRQPDTRMHSEWCELKPLHEAAEKAAEMNRPKPL